MKKWNTLLNKYHVEDEEDTYNSSKKCMRDTVRRLHFRRCAREWVGGGRGTWREEVEAAHMFSEGVCEVDSDAYL